MFSSRVFRFWSCLTGRAFLVGALLLTVCTVGISQESTGWWGSYYLPGNTAFSAAVGLGFNNGIAIDLNPGAEVMVTKIRY